MYHGVSSHSSQVSPSWSRIHRCSCIICVSTLVLSFPSNGFLLITEHSSFLKHDKQITNHSPRRFSFPSLHRLSYEKAKIIRCLSIVAPHLLYLVTLAITAAFRSPAPRAFSRLPGCPSAAGQPVTHADRRPSLSFSFSGS